ncbi:hypothetical protein HYS54_02535 [Candidatus Micrarchaeota archaeon]|nr:hypothetical protein [Candidatus Micrarchaeota archaeon]
MVGIKTFLPLLDVNQLFEQLQREGKSIRSFLLYRDPDFRITLFFALGFYADMYLQMVEDALKKKKQYEASSFAKKAEQARALSRAVFGKLPDKDYYSGGFKPDHDVVTSVPQDQLLQVAQFSVANVQLPPELVQDFKAVGRELQKQFRAPHKGQTAGAYVDSLSALARKYRERPDDLQTVLELFLLLNVVEQTLELLKKQTAAAQQKQAGPLPQRKHYRATARGREEGGALAGFKVGGKE